MQSNAGEGAATCEEHAFWRSARDIINEASTCVVALSPRAKTQCHLIEQSESK